MLITTRLFVLLSAALFLISPVRANPFETTLGNGLRVIVKEDRRSPTAVHMVWYRVGAMDEVDGHSGLAHLLEHMMFKGTPAIGPGEFSKRVSAAGGRDNAFTGHDYTAYYQQVPKEKLEDMMALEADRMRHLNVDPKEFSQELRVVMEERRMRTDDNPHAKLFEQMNAVAFQAHPYRRPVIGWMNDLENMMASDAKDWYDRWYVPNNAYVVVVGDVDHQEVFQLAQKYYGPLEGRPLPLRRPQTEPEQKGMRRINVRAPAELPMLVMGYKVPVLRDVMNDREPYALEMLGAILDGYEAARFGKHLVREQRVAVEIGLNYDPVSRGPGMFYLYGTPAEGKTAADLETALRNEIGKIQRDGIAEAELGRAKAQLLAAQIYKLDSMHGQAMEIGVTEASGLSYRDIDRMIERIRQVTTAEVQAVARKYLTDEGLTLGVLEPQSLKSPDKTKR